MNEKIIFLVWSVPSIYLLWDYHKSGQYNRSSDESRIKAILLCLIPVINIIVLGLVIGINIYNYFWPKTLEQQLDDWVNAKSVNCGDLMEYRRILKTYEQHKNLLGTEEGRKEVKEFLSNN